MIYTDGNGRLDKDACEFLQDDLHVQKREFEEMESILFND